MKVAASISVALVVLLGSPLTASGPLGIYGIVEKVVFEPDEKAAERIQVWGAFAYVDGGLDRSLAVSPAKRGFLYFTLPILMPASKAQADVIRREWADLKAVAGTGQAVGFGSWGYSGRFSGLRPDASASEPPHIFEAGPRGGELTDLRVRPVSEAPRAPAGYQTNTGLVRLAADGSHAAIVRELRSALAGSSFRLEIGPPVAGISPNIKKNTAFVVRPLACADPAKARITGVAEGYADGTRRSIALDLVPLTTPGGYAIQAQWPKGSGPWVVGLAGTCGTATAGAIVPIRQNEFVRESITFLERSATAREIESSLGALASQGTK
jgi:hypothetical protein